MAKYRLTVFARFFIFLIIITPLIYLGASYYSGQDGLANIKSLLGIENGYDQTTPQNQQTSSSQTAAEEEGTKNYHDLLKEKQDSIRLLKKALKNCK